jgi:hypothetical protein
VTPRKTVAYVAGTDTSKSPSGSSSNAYIRAETH